MEKQQLRDGNTHWLGFTPDTPETAAVARFMERFGREPAVIMRVPNVLQLGPVEVNER